jgi:ABC-2 type transport system permease protein
MDVIDATHDKLTWGSITTTVVLLLIATAFYVLSWLLYKKRKIEKCEDASAFKAFNYILKYAVTLALAIFAFEVFNSALRSNLPLFVMATLILTSVAYFGTEMILQKKIKVWNAYKGYGAFVLLYTALLFFMAFTSIFGYETYVPEVTEIERAHVSSKASSGILST